MHSTQSHKYWLSLSPQWVNTHIQQSNVRLNIRFKLSMIKSLCNVTDIMKSYFDKIIIVTNNNKHDCVLEKQDNYQGQQSCSQSDTPPPPTPCVCVCSQKQGCCVPSDWLKVQSFHYWGVLKMFMFRMYSINLGYKY